MYDDWLQSYARSIVLKTLSQIHRGQITVEEKYPEKEKDIITLGEPAGSDSNSPTAHIVVKNPNAWTRCCNAFDLGFAEAYMLQEIECENLVAVFSLYIANRNTLGYSSSLIYQIAPRIMRLAFQPSNNLTHSRLNASFHYDTSNDLFAGFLSSDMNYSSALWSDDPDESLESAQNRKIRNIMTKVRISATDHVLDIGCGWGDLSINLCRTTGCRVTGLTLSEEQKRLAETRIQEAGLEDRITILLCDYRRAPSLEGGYDRIISVEMLEHVGEKFLVEYFANISRLLKPNGGVMVVQGITNVNFINDNRPPVDTFIDRYVFPGGYLPTINQLLTAIHAGSQGLLEVESVQNIGPHYIRTLQAWRENFVRNWDEIRKSLSLQQVDRDEDYLEATRRKWLYYFQYCEAGFRMRILGDFVISAVRTPIEDIS